MPKSSTQLNKQEAIEKYLSKNIRGNKIIDNLMLWDSSKSPLENAKICDLKNSVVFAQRYDLSYARKRKNATALNRDNIKKMIAAGLTQSEISRLCKTSRQRIEQILNVKDVKRIGPLEIAR